MPYLKDCVLLPLFCLPCLFCSVAYPCLILCRSYWLLLLHYYYGYYFCILLHCVSSCVLRSLFIVHPFTHTYTHRYTHTPTPRDPHPPSLAIYTYNHHTYTPSLIRQYPHPKKCHEKGCKVPSPYPRIFKGFACKVPSGYIKKLEDLFGALLIGIKPV